MNYAENVRNKIDIENQLRYEEDSMSLNRIKINADRVRIMLMSDEHMGSREYNEKLHMETLERAYDTGMYILHLGDGIEAATRNSVGSGVYLQEQIIDKQMQNFIAKYQPFVDDNRFIGAHVGNHEMRAMNDDGINLMRQMCRQMGTRYLGLGKVHHLRIGKQTYTAYTTHGASGATKTHTKIAACLNLEKVVDVEIYAMGHLHQLTHHVRNFYGINKSKKQVQVQKKHFVLTGSYLNYPGSYAQMKCMEPARLGSPVIQLSGVEHKISVALE